jgi:hypothetical protein
MADTPIGWSATRLDLAGRWATPPPPATSVVLQNLVHAMFTDIGDAGRLAELFTADAEWDGSSLGYGSAEGPDGIAELVCRHINVDEPMMHMPGPVLLSAVDDVEANGISWCTATRWRDGATRPVIYFYYDDVFSRAADSTWRFRRRGLHAAFPR